MACTPSHTVMAMYIKVKPATLVRLDEYQKAVSQEEVEKLGITDHIWKETGSIYPRSLKLK